MFTSVNFQSFQVLVIAAILLTRFCVSQKDSEAKIIDYVFTKEPSGGYHFRLKTSNGITREDTGKIVNKGKPNESLAVTSKYSYVNPKGQLKSMTMNSNDPDFVAFEPVDRLPRAGRNTTRIPDKVLATLLG